MNPDPANRRSPSRVSVERIEHRILREEIDQGRSILHGALERLSAVAHRQRVLATLSFAHTSDPPRYLASCGPQLAIELTQNLRGVKSVQSKALTL
jgi:hypothetical protein